MGPLEGVLSWRLVAELWRRFPDRFRLIETHPGGGQYDCLSLVTRGPEPVTVLDVNRVGSLHVTGAGGAAGGSWRDWPDRILGSSGPEFLDEVTRALGLTVPRRLPASTPSTVAYRFVAEFLTHSVGRREAWECRNGYCDTSGWGGGPREDWFSRLPHVPVAERPPRAAAFLGEPAYHYWFLLREGVPELCLGDDGTAYAGDGAAHDLFGLYRRKRAVWPVITAIALNLLP